MKIKENSQNNKNSAIIIPNEVTTITPTNQALYEAGKSLLIESVSTGREFCKFMIGTCMSAIPIYLALLKFILPENFVSSFSEGLLALIPALLFLIAGIIFVVGYFPQKGIASLDLPEEIERERRKTVKRRQLLSIIGFSLFCIAVAAALWIAISLLQLPKQIPNE